jgi:hypothetical protein
MFTTRTYVWWLAALLVFAGLHCVCGHEISIDEQGFPHKHCHNEFGCICKGATLVSPVAIDNDGAVAPLDFLRDCTVIAGGQPTVALREWEGVASPPPLAGRSLRALLVSLVI